MVSWIVGDREKGGIRNGGLDVNCMLDIPLLETLSLGLLPLVLQPCLL